MVSMTEDDRPNEFQNAMEAFKNLGVNIVSYKMLGQENVDQGAKLPDLVEEKVIWEKVVREQNLSPDITLTHNEVGEYGHGAHILLSAVADDLFSNVWNFIYPKGQQPYKEKINRVQLTQEFLKQKTEIFNSSYKSQDYIWDNLNNLMDYEFKTGPEIFTSN